MSLGAYKAMLQECGIDLFASSSWNRWQVEIRYNCQTTKIAVLKTKVHPPLSQPNRSPCTAGQYHRGQFDFWCHRRLLAQHIRTAHQSHTSTTIKRMVSMRVAPHWQWRASASQELVMDKRERSNGRARAHQIPRAHSSLIKVIK